MKFLSVMPGVIYLKTLIVFSFPFVWVIGNLPPLPPPSSLRSKVFFYINIINSSWQVHSKLPYLSCLLHCMLCKIAIWKLDLDEWPFMMRLEKTRKWSLGSRIPRVSLEIHSVVSVSWVVYLGSWIILDWVQGLLGGIFNGSQGFSC